MFDLTKNDLSVAAEAGYEFELMLPTGEPTGAFITVRGEQSPAVKAYGRKMFNMYQQKQKIAKRKGKDSDDIDLDDAEDMQIETAFVRMIGWKEIAENGKAVEFTPENAKRILRAHSWIREMIMEESSNLHNFR